jgi:AhpD family alkylhydroperoxidase
VAEHAAGLWARTPTLWIAYAGGLDASLRERVMVAVSRANSCSGCTAVHERWALRSGVTDEELEAIGLDDLARLDERSRAAVVYATALAEARFRRPPDPELLALVRPHLSRYELRAVEAVARLIAFANLSANTMRSRTTPAARRPGGRRNIARAA